MRCLQYFLSKACSFRRLCISEAVVSGAAAKFPVLELLSDRHRGLADSSCSRNVLVMPEHLYPVSPHPSRPHRTLQDAANDGMVLDIRCNRCHRQVTYLALDLLKVCGPSHPLHVPPFGCGKCGSAEFVRLRTRIPSPEEYGRLAIRRPVKQVWKWRVGVLGE